jgi:pre-mRNA-processing factor 39
MKGLSSHRTFMNRFQQHAQSRPSSELLAPNEEKQLEAEFSKVFKRGDAEQVKKEIILKWRAEQYKKTAAELAKRRDFELKIQRPYFHTVAIDEPQLQNWRLYLDFEEKQGDEKRIIRLYEKCMVPCAQYMEFWNKYVRYLEKQNKIKEAKNILLKPVRIFLKRRF